MKLRTPIFRHWRCSLIPAGLVALCSLALAADELGRPDLSSETFRQRVTGSLGVLPDREPMLNEGEIAVLERLAPMIQKTPDLVITALENMSLDGRPVSATFDQMLGSIYADAGQYEKAEEAYLRAISKFPDFRRAWNSLGSLLMEADRYAEAIPALSRSVELGAADAHTYGLLGYALLQEEQYLAAETAYNMALLREPSNLRWLEGKVRIVAESGRHEQAVAAIDELLRRDPNRAAYWRLQSNAYLALEDFPHAARDLEIARLVGDVNADTLYLLGGLYMKQGLPNLAFNAYLEAMELQPAVTPGVVIGASRALIAKERFDLASKLVDAGGKELEKWPDVALLERELILGQLAEQEEQLEEARAAYERALAIDPISDEGLYRLGKLLVRLEQPAEAEQVFGRIAGNPDFEFAAQLQVARLRIEANRLESALKPLRRAVLLRPGSEAETLYNRVVIAVRDAEKS